MILSNATTPAAKEEIARPAREYDSHIQQLRESEYPQLKGV
jgi:hypothetical protein